MNWLKAKWGALAAWWHKFYADLTKPEFNPLWQSMHFLGGALIPALFYVAHPTGRSLCLGFLLTDVVWVLPKEFIWDVIVEKASLKGGLDDAYHYWAGSLLTLLIYGLGRI